MEKEKRMDFQGPYSHVGAAVFLRMRTRHKTAVTKGGGTGIEEKTPVSVRKQEIRYRRIDMDFILEEWKEDHIAGVAKYANNEKIAGRLRDSFPYPYTKEDAQWFVGDCMEKEGKTQLSRAIVVDGEAVGSIAVMLKDDVYCKSAELGYWLGEPFWRKGIMTRAVQQMCEEAFRRYKLVRIYAEPFPRTWLPEEFWKKLVFSWRE